MVIFAAGGDLTKRQAQPVQPTEAIPKCCRHPRARPPEAPFLLAC
jgi:hypothetical protein